MKRWESVKLKVITDLITKGTTPSTYGFNFEPSGINYIRAEGISKEGYVDESTFLKISEECHQKLKRSQLKKNDILFSIAGMALGKTGLVEDKYLPANTNQAVAIIRPKNRVVDAKYLLYHFINPQFYKIVNSVSGQAAQPNINLEQVGSLFITLPPIDIQRKIASILSAYDDLIENNLKRIKLLEELAQRTYEEWFVKFRVKGKQLKVKKETGLPEGWESHPMTQIADFLNGFAFKPSDWLETGIPIIKIKELKAGIGNDTPRNDGSRLGKRYLIQSGDILFSWSGSLEVVIWQGEDGWLNQHLFKVSPINGVPREFVHQALLYALNEFNSLTTGATMKHIKRKELDFVEVALPSKPILNAFERSINPVQEQILNLSKQNRLLKEARDILLPRLMSGVIDLEERKNGELALAAEPGLKYKNRVLV